MDVNTLITALLTAVTSAGLLQLVSWWYNRREDRRKKGADADTQSASAAEILSKAAATFAAGLEPRLREMEERLDKANDDLLTMSKELAVSYTEINELKKELARVLHELDIERDKRRAERAERDHEIAEWRKRHDQLQRRVQELELSEKQLRAENLALRATVKPDRKM